MRFFKQGAVLAFTFLSVVAHGSTTMTDSLPQDDLEGKLRACCTAAGVPESYENVRASIDRFTDKISEKPTVLGKMRLLEKCFQVPEKITLGMTEWYAKNSLEHSERYDAISQDHRAGKWPPEGAPSSITAEFLKEAEMPQYAFGCLSFTAKVDVLAQHYKNKKASPLKVKNGNAPHMIYETTLRHYNTTRVPENFALLYYCFMLTQKEERRDLWAFLIAFNYARSYGKGFEHYPDLGAALEDLPYTPFPCQQ